MEFKVKFFQLVGIEAAFYILRNLKLLKILLLKIIQLVFCDEKNLIIKIFFKPRK